MTLQLVGTHLAGSESQHFFMMQWLQCALLLQHPKFWGPNSVQPRKIAGILLPFFTVVVSPLRWNPGAVHSPLPQRRGKQAISRFTKQCPEQRSDQYHQKVLVYRIHNTFRIRRDRRKSNSSQGNATVSSQDFIMLNTIKRRIIISRGTKRATPKQRESHYLS